MKRINLLDKKIYDKIAAGEIVESPVSVVKELLENSLDAGANIIEINIENAGMSLIRVIDNGSGIYDEDIEKAFLSHATSKISSEEDLEEIETFGFRGEALASISAVSDIEIISKTELSATGTYLNLSEGIIKGKGLKRISTGTKIEVRNLFFNLPARKKFITNLNTETSRISELISNYALGHPNVDFIFKKDRDFVIDTRGFHGLEKRIENILASKKEEYFVVNDENESLRIKAILFHPLISRNNKKSQIFFVNGRLIRSILLNNILEEAYETLISKGRYPIAILNIDLDPKLLDVNIHPAKIEVRFLNEVDLRKKILPVLRKTLIDGINYKNKISDIAIIKEPLPVLRNEEISEIDNGHWEPQETISIQKLNFSSEPAKNINESTFLIKEENHLKFPSIGDLKIIGQFKNSFILAESDTDLYIIDQHVVHERILYEKFSRIANENKVIKEPLLHPETLFLKPEEEGILIKHIITLNDLGFEVESFGPRTYLIRTIPSGFPMENLNSFFLDLLEDLEKYNTSSIAKIKEAIIINASCKSAIKANDKLSIEKIKFLLSELAKTENYHTCPHGRPIIKKISIKELYRYFQRGGYND